MIKEISARNRELFEKDSNFIVGYFLAGYPDYNIFLELVKEIDESELDILEIGFPSRNPYADGEVIKQAHSKVDLDICTHIEYFRKIRNNTEKPIWLMAYYKDFIENSLYKDFAKEKLMDAIVIPDCSHERHLEIKEELADYNIDVLGFIRPDMGEKELHEVLGSMPIIYAQLYTGPTGVEGLKDEYHAMAQKALTYKTARTFAGFGINTKEKAYDILINGFSGAIVGTEMIKRLNVSNKELLNFIIELKSASKKAKEVGI